MTEIIDLKGYGHRTSIQGLPYKLNTIFNASSVPMLVVCAAGFIRSRQIKDMAESLSLPVANQYYTGYADLTPPDRCSIIHSNNGNLVRMPGRFGDFYNFRSMVICYENGRDEEPFVLKELVPLWANAFTSTLAQIVTIDLPRQHLTPARLIEVAVL